MIHNNYDTCTVCSWVQYQEIEMFFNNVEHTVFHLGIIPYSGLFLYGGNFHIFRIVGA